MAFSSASSSTSLPPYSAIASPPPAPPPSLPPRKYPSRPTPSINLLLLGSPNIGKSTFISRLPFVRDGRLQTPSPSPTFAGPAASQSSSPLSPTPPANPATFHVSLFARPYTISLYRSTSALFIDPFPEKIDALVLCFAVDDRVSLFNMKKYWARVFNERYDEVPRLVLGLRRDLRHAGKQPRGDLGEGERRGRGRGGGGGEDGEEEEEYMCVMPEEGLEAAKDLQCDRYAECSALTGELMFEVLEDITRMAAGTTTDNGGFSQGDGCVVL